jgi:hypothetical protein
VAVRVAEVAAQLAPVVDRCGEEVGAAGAPVGVDLTDVRHADVEEAADAVGILRRLERDRGFVVRRAAPDVDDDPAVGERHDRRLALANGLAPQHLGVEAP